MYRWSGLTFDLSFPRIQTIPTDEQDFPKLFLVFVMTTAFAPSVVAEESLYDRMGGAPVLARVVDKLMRLNRENPRTKRSFQKISVKRFRETLGAALHDRGRSLPVRRR